MKETEYLLLLARLCQYEKVDKKSSKNSFPLLFRVKKSTLKCNICPLGKSCPTRWKD